MDLEMNEAVQKPLRALHVLGTLNRGGIETWFMHMLRAMDRQTVALDVVVHTEEEGEFEGEVRALGASVFHCPTPTNPLQYARDLRAVLKSNGPYQVAHSHVYDFSGYVLRIAGNAGVPVRIAHSHTDRLLRMPLDGCLRRVTLPLQRYWIRRYATVLLGASEQAAQSLFGTRQHHTIRSEVLLYGIDLSQYGASPKSSALRDKWGISNETLVVGHVGRFDSSKNQRFAVDVFSELIHQGLTARLLLVGDGASRQQVEQHVNHLGLVDKVIFTGIRGDVPELMQSVMDVLLFPSKYEGLGLVLVEAQAAGLPCIYSDAIPVEADVVPQLLTRLSLNQRPSVWAKAICHARSSSQLSRAQALQAVSKSAFNVTRSVDALQNLYATEIAAVRDCT